MLNAEALERSEEGVRIFEQPDAKGRKCFSAMAHGGFSRAVELGQRAAERRVKEDRVVAEPVRPSRLAGDFSFHDSLRLEQEVVSCRDRDVADEPRSAAGHAALAKELLDSPELRRVVSAVPARRVDAGRL